MKAAGLYITDIMESIDKIIEYTSGISKKEFLENAQARTP